MKHLLLTTIAAVVLVGCGPSVPDISIQDATVLAKIEIIKQHIAAGTDINEKDSYDRTPLLCAITQGHEEIAELLIAEGADVNAKKKKAKLFYMKRQIVIVSKSPCYSLPMALK